MAQGGDFESNDGIGGQSIYGPTFADENFNIHFDKPYLIAMANNNIDPDTNGSQFFITFRETKWLNNHHVVFGEVIDDFGVVKLLEEIGTSDGWPSKKAVIVDAGILWNRYIENED